MFLNLRNMTIVNVNVLAHQTCSSHLHVNNLYPKKLLVEIVGVRHSFPAPIDDLALIHHGETDLPTFSAMGLISLLHMYVLLNRGNSGLTFHIRNVHLNKCWYRYMLQTLQMRSAWNISIHQLHHKYFKFLYGGSIEKTHFPTKSSLPTIVPNGTTLLLLESIKKQQRWFQEGRF